jgi:hypothetical protein
MRSTPFGVSWFPLSLSGSRLYIFDGCDFWGSAVVFLVFHHHANTIAYFAKTVKTK